MAEHWQFVDTGAGRPAWNMAFDEALLFSVSDVACPTLRFYSWTIPAATFGYFQKYEEVAAMTPLRPLIRRPTGGGVVPHENDWTYSLAIPVGHEWHRMQAAESYRRLHEWVAEALRIAGEDASLAECCESTGPGQCFIGAEMHDVLVSGRKAAGAAQRRNKLGLLIQGSVQADGMTASRSQWVSAMQAAAIQRFGVLSFEDLPQPEAIGARARELEEGKYIRDEHNRCR